MELTRRRFMGGMAALAALSLIPFKWLNTRTEVHTLAITRHSYMGELVDRFLANHPAGDQYERIEGYDRMISLACGDSVVLTLRRRLI